MVVKPKKYPKRKMENLKLYWSSCVLNSNIAIIENIMYYVYTYTMGVYKKMNCKKYITRYAVFNLSRKCQNEVMMHFP